MIEFGYTCVNILIMLLVTMLLASLWATALEIENILFGAIGTLVILLALYWLIRLNLYALIQAQELLK